MNPQVGVSNELKFMHLYWHLYYVDALLPVAVNCTNIIYLQFIYVVVFFSLLARAASVETHKLQFKYFQNYSCAVASQRDGNHKRVLPSSTHGYAEATR